MKLEYHNHRRKYDKIFSERVESWKKFMAEAGENLWSYVYKLTSIKIRGQQAINSIRTDTGFTTNWRESAEVLLDNLFVHDEPVEDSLKQELIRTEMKQEYDGDDDLAPVI